MFDNDFFENFYRKKHCFFRADGFDISWDDIMENFNLGFKQTPPDIKVRENLAFVLHQTLTPKLLPVQMFADDLSQTFSVPTETHYYVSFLDQSKTFGKHKDKSCVFFYQAIGVTRFTVYDKETLTYELEKGDMLYIPAGMYHDTKPLTPRVGISFGLEYEKV